MSAPLKSSDVVGGYIPTAEDKEKLKRKPGIFKLSGDGIFHTIQGEGQFAGRPTTFIRLAVCNLKCSWCDAWYTRRTDTKEYYDEQSEVDIDQLFEMIKESQSKYGVICKDITITGGEPMLQQLTIIAFLNKYGNYFNRVQIETNGTIPPLPELLNNERVFYNCSPKLNSSDNLFKIRYNEKVLRMLSDTNRAIFKFVFSNQVDINEIIELYHFIPDDHIRLMPEGVLVEEHREVFDQTIDFILKSGLNVAVRCQSIIWDGAKRGV